MRPAPATRGATWTSRCRWERRARTEPSDGAGGPHCFPAPRWSTGTARALRGTPAVVASTASSEPGRRALRGRAGRGIPQREGGASPRPGLRTRHWRPNELRRMSVVPGARGGLATSQSSYGHGDDLFVFALGPDQCVAFVTRSAAGVTSAAVVLHLQAPGVSGTGRRQSRYGDRRGGRTPGACRSTRSKALRRWPRCGPGPARHSARGPHVARLPGLLDPRQGQRPLHGPRRTSGSTTGTARPS